MTDKDMPDLSQLTERGAKAWAGVDAQALREGRAADTSNERKLMELIDAYAEARHVGGCHTYNAKTAEARAKVVASLSANTGEPVAWLVSKGGIFVDSAHTSLTSANVAAMRNKGAVVLPLYLAAPPTAQAEGWISVDERLPDEARAYGRESDDCLVELPNKRFTCAMVVRTTGGPKWLDQDSRVVYPVRWMRIPPTSAEWVEHG